MLFDLFMKRLIKHGTLHVRLPQGELRSYGTGQGPVAGFAVRSRAALHRLGPGCVSVTYSWSTQGSTW